MRRILKPGGYGLHIFPARGLLIEPHVNVPLATIVQNRSWLSLWARLGVRTTRQKQMHWREVAERNYVYLTSSTNYLTGPALKRQFQAHFAHVRYADNAFLKHSPHRRGQLLSSIARKVSADSWALPALLVSRGPGPRMT
jgi:hypothetical protein